MDMIEHELMTEHIFIGGLDGLKLLAENGITHVLSLQRLSSPAYIDMVGSRVHRVVHVDDEPNVNLLEALPQIINFIKEGTTTVTENGEPGRVFVHCTAGRSRSAAVAAAWLLYRHAIFFKAREPRTRTNTGTLAASGALRVMRRTRAAALPNEGFMRQLAMWWEIECPADADSLNRHPTYGQWWLDTVQRLGRWWCLTVPFADAGADRRGSNNSDGSGNSSGSGGGSGSGSGSGGGSSSSASESRYVCKRCDKEVARGGYLIPHGKRRNSQVVLVHKVQEQKIVAKDCSHYFVRPLKWMQKGLEKDMEKNLTEGYLDCDCGARLGKYVLRGFICECGVSEYHSFGLRTDKVVHG